MDKLIEYQMNPPDPAMFMEKYNVGISEAIRMAMQTFSERLFRNDIYQVTMGAPHDPQVMNWPKMTHLSIVRLDGQNIHSWSDLQQIKNQLMGPEYEAIEIYPAESRLVDCGANYHLWCFTREDFRVPIGWDKRMVKEELHGQPHS